MEKLQQRRPFEPTFSDRMTVEKDITARSLPYLARGEQYAVCLNQVITFGGDIERLRQYLSYGKQYGISQISNEGIASIAIFWTDIPQQEPMERDDICIVKPFILRPELDASQLILYEQAFRSISPKKYLRFQNNPSELALELYSDIT